MRNTVEATAMMDRLLGKMVRQTQAHEMTALLADVTIRMAKDKLSALRGVPNAKDIADTLERVMPMACQETCERIPSLRWAADVVVTRPGARPANRRHCAPMSASNADYLAFKAERGR